MTSTDAQKQKLHPAPDVGDIIFLFIILIPLVVKPNFLFGDGSTGWHLVTGDYILKNHAVPHHDLFTYAATIPGNPDKSWVAYEWLSDALMALIVQIGGLNLLAVCVSCAIGLVFLILYDRCRREGCHFLIVLFICIVGALVSVIHWLARPHIFTFFGVLIFSTALEDYYRRTISSTKLIAYLSLYMLVWVNCHPAFVVGFVLMGIYLVSSLVSAVVYEEGPERKAHLQTARTLLMAMGAVFVASLINPNGIALYQYIVHYLKGSAILAATEEFMSPVFHLALQPTCLELLFAIFIIGLAITQRKLSLPRLLCCLAFSHLTLSAVRNMPLFAIIVLPAIAQLYSKVRVAGDYRATEASQPSKLWRGLVEKWNRIGAGIDDEEWRCKMHLIPIGAFILFSVASLMGGKIAGTEVVNSGFDPADKPSATLDYLKKAEDEGKLKADRGFNFDNWGGYIKYKLGTPVYIDDRADFYGEEYYNKYAIINQVVTYPDGKPGWQDYLKKDNIQWVLVQRQSQLAAALKHAPGWTVAAEDKASYLFVHDGPY